MKKQKGVVKMTVLSHKGYVLRKKSCQKSEDPYVVAKRLEKSIAHEIKHMTPEKARYLLSQLSMYNENGELIDEE